MVRIEAKLEAHGRKSRIDRKAHRNRPFSRREQQGNRKRRRSAPNRARLALSDYSLSPKGGAPPVEDFRAVLGQMDFVSVNCPKDATIRRVAWVRPPRYR